MKRRGSHRRIPALKDATDPQGMAALTEQYFQWMRVRNYSERTVGGAAFHLRHFGLWLAERGVTRPNEVVKPMLDRYQRYLYYYRSANGRPMGFHSQAARLGAIRHFFRFLTKQNLLLYNPASEIELPKYGSRLPKHVLSIAEVECVLTQPDLNDPLGVRDRAILETLYSTGVRRVEILALQLYDLDVERQTLRVRFGKGKKERIIPIGERALQWLEKYLTEVRPSLAVEPDCGLIFLTIDGQPISSARLSQVVTDYVAQANIGKTGSCHLFRHTMATLMLEGGADVRFIQEMLGHAKLDTTQIYTQVSIRALKAVYDSTHPGARLRPVVPTVPELSTANETNDDERVELLSALDAESDDDD